MNWTREKPNKVGVYLRSNIKLQDNINVQHVFETKEGLATVHPMNEQARVTLIEDMPSNFIWLKIPHPKTFNEWKKP